MEQISKVDFQIDERLIETNVRVSNWKSALKKISDLLIKNKYVKKGFYEALTSREMEFPTGIQLDGFGVAIPHVEPQYVNKTAIALITLEDNVKFRRMDDLNESVSVGIIFGLAVEDPQKHLGILQSIIQLIQDRENLKKLKEAQDKEKILNILCGLND